MQKKLSLGLLFGLIGNALFILFAIMAYWYYLIFDPYSTFCKVLEHTTYAVLFSGFIALAVSDVLLCITVVGQRKKSLSSQGGNTVLQYLA